MTDLDLAKAKHAQARIAAGQFADTMVPTTRELELLAELNRAADEAEREVQRLLANQQSQSYE